jgi:hypothetical protein
VRATKPGEARQVAREMHPCVTFRALGYTTLADKIMEAMNLAERARKLEAAPRVAPWAASSCSDVGTDKPVMAPFLSAESLAWCAPAS